MVGARHEIGKGGKHLSLKLGGELLGSPNLADLALGTAAVTLAEQYASKSQPASSSSAGRLPVQEATHRHGVTPLLPQRSFCALAQEAEARPGRIVADERYIAAEIRATFLGA